MKKSKTSFQGKEGLSFLTREQMQKIHSNTLRLLEEVGVEIQQKEAIELLEKAGCYVEKKRVRFPSGLVEWAIKRAPSKFSLYDREGNFAMDVSGKNVYYGAGSACPNVTDVYTGEIRICTEEDNKQLVKVVDQLQYIDFMMSMAQVYDHPKTSYDHEYAAMIRYSSKPQVVIAADIDSLENIIKMASVVRGGLKELVNKPLFILYCEPTSPLVCTKDSIEKVMYMAKNRLPVLYAPCPMNGATSPITCAGSLIQANAESLVGVILAQVINPGTPVLYGAIVSNMDLKSLQPTYASPETMMTSLAMVQLGREFYELPTWGTAGCTSSKMPDEQAVMEGTQYITLAGLAGANVIHDVGYTTFGLSYSIELTTMMNEAIGRMRRVFDGIDTSDESLCMDDLLEIGPKGHFLAQDSTVKINRENWEPDIEDRTDLDQWRGNGSKSMRDRAREKVINILENKEYNMLPKELDDQIVKILEEADKLEIEN